MTKEAYCSWRLNFICFAFGLVCLFLFFFVGGFENDLKRNNSYLGGVYSVFSVKPINMLIFASVVHFLLFSSVFLLLFCLNFKFIFFT